MRIKDWNKAIAFMMAIQKAGGLEKLIGKPVNPGKLINIFKIKRR